jgi:hypothetical protein
VLEEGPWRKLTQGLAATVGDQRARWSSIGRAPSKKRQKRSASPRSSRRSDGAIVVATVTWPKKSFDAWWSEQRGSLPSQANVPLSVGRVHLQAPGRCARSVRGRQLAIDRAGRTRRSLRAHGGLDWIGDDRLGRRSAPVRRSLRPGDRYMVLDGRWVRTCRRDAGSIPRYGRARR